MRSKEQRHPHPSLRHVLDLVWRQVSWAACRARDQEVSLLRAALAERDMRLRDSKSELLGAPPRPAPHA